MKLNFHKHLKGRVLGLPSSPGRFRFPRRLPAGIPTVPEAGGRWRRGRRRVGGAGRAGGRGEENASVFEGLVWRHVQGDTEARAEPRLGSDCHLLRRLRLRLRHAHPDGAGSGRRRGGEAIYEFWQTSEKTAPCGGLSLPLPPMSVCPAARPPRRHPASPLPQPPPR